MAGSTVVMVRVIGGPQARVPWRDGITALQAMELAQGVIEPRPDEQFTFGLQFYGAALGYLVNMINETYDSFISRGGESATPFFYWHFLVNDEPARASVDRTTLADGDVVTFEFARFIPEQHKGTLLAAKHAQQTGSAQR